MDLAKFKEDLVCALGRPEEWESAVAGTLLHRRTGIKVYASGNVYRSVAALICTVPQRMVNRCWSAVSKQETEARCRNSERDREAFLKSFPGFRG